MKPSFVLFAAFIMAIYGLNRLDPLPPSTTMGVLWLSLAVAWAVGAVLLWRAEK